jgi:hypothetical protein
VEFSFSRTFQKRNLTGLSVLQRGVLSHHLRRGQRANSAPPSIDENSIPKVDNQLPSPAERADSLILWIGDHQLSPESPASFFWPEVSAWIGAAINKTDSGLEWLLRQDEVKSLYESSKYTLDERHMDCRLSFAGWQRYEELKRAELNNVFDLKAGGMGNLGPEQLAWLADDLKGKSDRCLRTN